MTTQETPIEVQATTAQEQQTVQVGFEKALVTMNPEWRTAFTTEQVNQFRHYYHQGIQDINLLNNINFQNAQQNFQAVLNTVIVTGNEDQIAELQRQAADAAAAYNAEVAANPIEDVAAQAADEAAVAEGVAALDARSTPRKKGAPTASKAVAKGPKVSKGKR